MASALLLTACGGGGGRVSTAATPVSGAAAPALPAAVPAPLRVALPARLVSTTWRVQSSARVTVTGDGGEQRIDSDAVVSWSAERQPHGALRASGQVDSFTVRTELDSRRPATAPAPAPVLPGLILLDATLDSGAVRVSTRPPLANECDRPEASAAAVARDLLVRVPNGVALGDRWRDSVVTLTCRSGVPIVVHTTVLSQLEELTDEVLVVRRDLAARYQGKGGTAFRTLELTGTGVGAQRARVHALRGTLERLEGTMTLTLQATERLPGSAPRSQQIVQRTEFSAVRAR
ncbi:hypothetical protein [Gemmatimonas sp.]|jgi:hypothetical protein|nr:hypothetical protein [Gemmatimonas sp.]